MYAPIYKDKLIEMKKTFYPALLLLMMALSFLVGSWYTARTSKVSGAGSRRILFYHDPMHPAYKSDQPGIAPDCGMQLEPVYAEGGDPTGISDPPSSLPPGTLNVNSEKQQIIGVRVSRVEIAPVKHLLRTLGRVAADETRTIRVTAADGWIEKIYPKSAGSIVRKGDLLATFYSKEFVPAQIAFFYLHTRGQLPKGSENTADYIKSQASEKELRALGMSEYQIQEIAGTQKAVTDVDLRAPIDGLVLARNVTPGMKFDRGTELYRIADLSRVWILADLFENEARYFKPGMQATISLPHQGKVFRARVSDVLPQFDASTRTLKVRLETDNPGYALRPDMFVDVESAIHLPPAIMVPADAILDSGRRRRVFVDLGDGFFEPRPVETGLRLDDRVEIVQGLKDGERIVVSGNFLLDSESRLRATTTTNRKTDARDPVCGMSVDPNSPEVNKSEFHGRTYRFCSGRCKGLFDKNPERYAEPVRTKGRMHDTSLNEKRLAGQFLGQAIFSATI